MIQVELDKESVEKIVNAFAEVGKASKRMLDQFMGEASTILASQFKANLYGEKLPLHPLKDSTLQAKIARGGDKRILLDTQQLVQSVMVKKLDKYAYFVGIPSRVTHKRTGAYLITIANTLEYGSMVKHIPPRPAWKMTSIQFNKKFPQLAEVYIKKHLLSFRKLV